MTIDISSLSKSELIALRKRVERAIEAFDAQNLARARKEAQRVAREYGVSVEDLTGTAPAPAKSKSKSKSKPKRRGKVAPKYRNPAEPSQTWTGRGRQPAWVAEALKGGARLEDLTSELEAEASVCGPSGERGDYGSIFVLTNLGALVITTVLLAIAFGNLGIATLDAYKLMFYIGVIAAALFGASLGAFRVLGWAE